MIDFNSINKKENDEPEFDVGICSDCGGKFHVDALIRDFGHHDGWEMPPYTEVSCPDCEDGGCVDDFTMSPIREIEWVRWYLKNNKVKP